MLPESDERGTLPRDRSSRTLLPTAAVPSPQTAGHTGSSAGDRAGMGQARTLQGGLSAPEYASMNL